MASDLTLYDSTGNPQVLAGDDLPTMGIESGSNENGSWTKYPDGTMIQHGYINRSDHIPDDTENINDTFTLPLAFIDTNYTVNTSLHTYSNAFGTITFSRNASASSVNITALRLPPSVENNAGDLNYYWQAIGRWK